MDPVSAVGLASSVLTFVEFAWNLLGGAIEIYRSVDGTLDENARLDDPTCKTRAERRIARVAEDCRSDFKTLQVLLKEIAGPRNNRAVWRSLKASWLSIRSRKEVAELKDRLQQYWSEVLLQVTLLLREEQSSINLGIARLRDDCSQLKIGFRTQISSTQNKILGAIDDLTKSTGETQATNDTSLADLSEMLRTIQAVVDDTNLHHRILRQLVFEDMDSRANQIPRAAQDTYNWTLEDGPIHEDDPRRLAWSIFTACLRKGDKLLHVSGNPGSGKSTLMKFLSQHERTKEELQVWAGVDALIFCVFYFWNPGSQMQRTLTGLYRSLLFQALSQCPELIREVFPVQFRIMKASVGDLMVEKIQNFDEVQIEGAFKLLLNRASSGGYRLCFFIDGLDECEGNRLQHEDMANLLETWVQSSDIKMCVSSRPYSEFLQPLDLPGNRLIQLHRLNGSDIAAYCHRRLENDIHAQRRGDLCRLLVPVVVLHAQGVFLWVHLVIDVLLVGFRQNDPDSVLEEKLKGLPLDLDMLYTKLREPIERDVIQRDRSNRMLLLAAHNPCRRDLTAVAFSWLEGQECDGGYLMNPDFPPVVKIKPYSEEEIQSRVSHVTRQIDGLARGFLEVWEDIDEQGSLSDWEDGGSSSPFFAFKVRFCHRTARDYLLQNEDRRRALLKSFPNFEDSQPYVRICLAETIHGGNSMFKESYDVFHHFDRSFRQTIDPDLISKFELAIQELVTPTSWDLYPAASTRPRSRDHQPFDHQTFQVSFIAYSAYCSLDSYVLSEIARDATKLARTSASGSILLAAVIAEHYDLASTLLTMSRGMNELCVVCDDNTDVQSLVPTCVIASGEVLRRLLVAFPAFMPEEGELETLKNLLKYSLDLNISMWATISWGHESEDGSISDDNAWGRLRIEVAVWFKQLETSTRGDTDCRIRSPYSWSKDEADGMHWLKKWLGQPYIEFLIGHYGRFLILEKIEWSSDTKELTELTGRVRIY